MYLIIVVNGDPVIMEKAVTRKVVVCSIILGICVLSVVLNSCCNNFFIMASFDLHDMQG